MHRRHLLFTAVLTLLVADVAAQITAGRPEPRIQGPTRPPRDATAAPETGTGRLRGVVVGGEAGLPLRRAMVRLSGGAIREGRATMTDANGRWELADLPAGRYSLVASKAGYLTLEFGQRRAFAPGRPIELADGQTLDVNFNLPRGAVLAGRIVDEFGEPVAGAVVQPMRYRFMTGRRRFVLAGNSDKTDDGGHFRIYGLPPGEFYLSVTPGSGLVMGATSTSSEAYAPTYYPGVISPQHAEPIVLSLGGEVSGLTFPLLPMRTVTISGTALDSQGRPIANASVEIKARDEMVSIPSGRTRTREDGSFRMTNVVPGDYTLIAVPMERMRGQGGHGELATADVTAGSGDISGVVLAPVRSATIRGRVVLEGGASAAHSPEAITIAAIPVSESSPAFMEEPRQLAPDWTFEFRVSRSPVIIRPLATPPGWSLASVLVGGEDVADTGVTFTEGETVTDVQIVLTTVRTHVYGSVIDDRGQPVPDYAVVVFADDPIYWRTMWSRRIQIAKPDQSGRWSVHELPPGHYVAAAVEEVEDTEVYDPALLERLRAVGTPFTLGEGGRHTMQLELVQVY